MLVRKGCVVNIFVTGFLNIWHSISYTAPLCRYKQPTSRGGGGGGGGGGRGVAWRIPLG